MTINANQVQDKLDDFCDIFERPNSPMKRSPAARNSKLSFLEEISDEDLKRYTPAQLNQILTQRAHVSIISFFGPF